MQWGGTRKELGSSVLHVTSAGALGGIPDKAHANVVHGRTSLERAIGVYTPGRTRKAGLSMTSKSGSRTIPRSWRFTCGGWRK